MWLPTLCHKRHEFPTMPTLQENNDVKEQAFFLWAGSKKPYIPISESIIRVVHHLTLSAKKKRTDPVLPTSVKRKRLLQWRATRNRRENYLKKHYCFWKCGRRRAEMFWPLCTLNAWLTSQVTSVELWYIVVKVRSRAAFRSDTVPQIWLCGENFKSKWIHN